jgi:hypothetical protein
LAHRLVHTIAIGTFQAVGYPGKNRFRSNCSNRPRIKADMFCLVADSSGQHSCTRPRKYWMTKRLLRQRDKEGTSIDEAQFGEISRTHSGAFFEDFRSGSCTVHIGPNILLYESEISTIPEDFRPVAETGDSRDNHKKLCTHAHHRNRHLCRVPNISTFNRDKPCHHVTMHAIDC